MSKNKMPAGGGTPTSKRKNNCTYSLTEQARKCKPFLGVIA